MIICTLRNTYTCASTFTDSSMSKKRTHLVIFTRVESALFRWVCGKDYKMVTLSNALVKLHAKWQSEDGDHLLLADEQIVLNFSKGSLKKFKRHFDLRICSIHCVAMTADDDVVLEKMPCLLCMESTYATADNLNVDDFEHFHRQPRRWMTSQKPFSRFKKKKGGFHCLHVVITRRLRARCQWS